MSKPSRTARMGSFFKGVKAEMRKVTWPSKKELWNYTWVTILISAAVAVTVGILDMFIHWVLGFII